MFVIWLLMQRGVRNELNSNNDACGYCRIVFFLAIFFDLAVVVCDRQDEAGCEMTIMSIKTLLEDIIDISEQIGITRGQRMCHGHSQQDAITEHGLRSILHGKKQELLHMTIENWQPITTLTHHTLMTKVVDVWSKRHGRIADVSYGQETYGEGVGIVYQADYDCNGPVYGLVKDATHWMIVKGPTE